MKNMGKALTPQRYPKKEAIGNPQFFCGRKKELDNFLTWAMEIPEEKSKSCALMATKKMGKTAILDRLYNLLFLQQGPVIPFFFAVREQSIWLKGFAQQFYCSFLTSTECNPKDTQQIIKTTTGTLFY